MTLGAAALLTGLLIFSAAPEQESDDDEIRDDPEILAAFRANRDAAEALTPQWESRGWAGETSSGETGLALLTIIS